MSVLVTAKGMLKWATPHCHIDSVPAWAAAALVIERRLKKAANSAAKNIRSEASQIQVPMATMSGRPLAGCRRAGAMGCTAPCGMAAAALE